LRRGFNGGCSNFLSGAIARCQADCQDNNGVERGNINNLFVSYRNSACQTRIEVHIDRDKRG
jgi:hypothetical protein